MIQDFNICLSFFLDMNGVILFKTLVMVEVERKWSGKAMKSRVVPGTWTGGRDSHSQVGEASTEHKWIENNYI